MLTIKMKLYFIRHFVLRSQLNGAWTEAQLALQEEVFYFPDSGSDDAGEALYRRFVAAHEDALPVVMPETEKEMWSFLALLDPPRREAARHE